MFACLVLATGRVNGPTKMQHIIDKNQDIQNSYVKAVDELGVLRDNLLKKEVTSHLCPLLIVTSFVHSYEFMYCTFMSSNLLKKGYLQSFCFL